MNCYLRTLSLAAILLSFVSVNSANALNFLINAETGSPNNRQSFDVNNDRWLLDLHDFPVSGPLTFANAPGGNPGIANTASDDPTTFASNTNVIVLQNFDNDDIDGSFPANWNNSFNARRALEAIASNTVSDRPGFYLYWNEKLGVNRLVYTDNLNDGTSDFQVLFAANSANLTANSDDLQADPTRRAEANANFNTLKSFTDGNFAAVPEPATMLLLGAGLAGLAGFGRKNMFKNK